MNTVIMRDTASSKQGLLDLIEANFKDRDNLIALQIGSYAGQSAQLFLSTGKFKEIYCVDPWEDGYDKKDPTAKTVEAAQKLFDKRFEKDPRVHKIKGYSPAKVKDLPDEYFDFIYVDGNHQEQVVYQDLEIAITKLKPDGVIAGHDYNPRQKWVEGVSKAVKRFLNRQPQHIFSDTSWSCRKLLIEV